MGTAANPDPKPKTGMVIFISRNPQAMKNLKQLRASTETSEDGLQELTQTVVAGLPAYHAFFISSESNRVLDDYHMLKDTDHWAIRFIFPGNSLPDVQREKRLYRSQLTDFLQSVQFQ